MNITIERAVEATPDLERLVAELNAVLGAAYPPHQRHGLALEQLFEPHMRFFLARLDGAAVGCGGVALFDGYAEVKRMYTRREARGRGVAKALLRRIEEQARAAGASVLYLETGIHQREAIGLYERMGFEHCDAFGPYAAMPAENIETSLFFTKALSPDGRRRAVTWARRIVPAVVLSWLIIAAEVFAAEIQPTVETTQATIEARDAKSLTVRFAAEGQPGLLFRPVRGFWDWSATGKIVIPVENPGEEPLTLRLGVESAAGRSLGGQVAIAARSAGNLTIWIEAPSPRAMGMVAGPPPPGPGALPLTATKGSVDAAHVTAIRLGIARPTAPRRLIVGLPRAAAPGAAEQHAYDAIVDTFGQYQPGNWPEKVSSIAMLRAVAAWEAPLNAGWLAKAPKRDRFSGLVGAAAFRATGFFRTERYHGRWWLVTPEGNPFFSIGIDVVKPSGSTYVEGREFMFADIPARDGALAQHWSERDSRRGLGAQRGRGFDHGHAFDFYTANLERKFGADWRQRWRDEAAARLQAWGFNTIGNWSDAELAALHRLPYTVPLSPVGTYAKVSSGEDWWGRMPDPFDPAFAAAADRMARDAAARFGGDPYLVGYFVDNELSWGKEGSKNPAERYSLPLGALAADPASSAKTALIAQLVDTYREPQRLGRAWGIPLASWSDLRRAGFALPPASLNNPAVIADLATFARRFAEAYFRTVAEALHRRDPGHLYLGSRFAWQTPEAVAACARWCDVVSFNVYRRSIAEDPDRWARFHALGKPALIGEFHFGSTDRGLFWEGLAGVGRESGRGPAYARYLDSVADNPDFVGAHWFAYLDEPLTGRTLDGENGHIGFVSVADVPYLELVAAARTANETVLRKLQQRATPTALGEPPKARPPHAMPGAGQ
jgi:GNAT superfamily N-acetyltransferase